MAKRGLLDGIFYLQKKTGCKDRRTLMATKVTSEEPWRLYTVVDLVKLEKNPDGSWTMYTPDGRTLIAEPGDYFTKYERLGEDTEYGVVQKGGIEYYDYNLCSESGIVIGHLPIVDPV